MALPARPSGWIDHSRTQRFTIILLDGAKRRGLAVRLCRSSPPRKCERHIHLPLSTVNTTMLQNASPLSVEREHMFRRTYLGLTAALLIAGPAFAGGHSKDIVDTAVGAGSFGTLVAAVQAAGLVDTLKGEGPFTVFAPTDAAFAALPAGTVEELLKPENKDKLTAILTYHVAAGRLVAADVVKLSKAPTLNGQQVDVRLQDGGVRLDNANVVKTDILCANGVIHVIDSVLLPRAA